MSKEQITETVDDFLTDIKKQYPGTTKYINSKYPSFKEKLESVISEVMASPQSVEMASQVNIYIFL